MACGLDLGGARNRIAAARRSTRVLLERGPSAIDIVDAATGTSLLQPPVAEGPLGSVEALAVSPDGLRVAGLGADQSLWLWGAGMAKPLVNPPETLWRGAVRFLTDDRLAVVTEGALRASAYRYDVGRNAIEATIDIPQQYRHGGFAVFSRDRLILDEVRETDYLHTVIDLRGGAAPYHLPAWKRPPGRQDLNLRNDALRGAVANGKLTRIYVAGDECHIHAWDVRSGALVADSRRSHGFTRDLVLTPDERYLIVGEDKGPIVVLDTGKLEEVRRLVGPTAHVTMVASSPDGKLVVAGARDGLFAWRLADGTRVATIDFSGSHEAPTALGFAPDGASLWVGTTLGNLYRFQVGR